MTQDCGQWCGTMHRQEPTTQLRIGTEKHFILPRRRFAKISNTSGLFPFPEAKKELILKKWDLKHFLCEVAGKALPQRSRQRRFSDKRVVASVKRILPLYARVIVLSRKLIMITPQFQVRWCQRGDAPLCNSAACLMTIIDDPLPDCGVCSPAPG